MLRIRPPSPEDAEDVGNLPFDPSSFIVKVPTLVIWGERDHALLTGNLDGLDEFVPDLTVKRVPDGTHWVIREKPSLVNSYLREFLSEE